MAKDSGIIKSPAEMHRRESSSPPADTKTNGVMGYGVPERTSSKNAQPEVTFDHNSPAKKGDL